MAMPAEPEVQRVENVDRGQARVEDDQQRLLVEPQPDPAFVELEYEQQIADEL